jgi:NAD(P)-dependent dehydrogenase (short-subunit alcohol dehydrogenase family)
LKEQGITGSHKGSRILNLTSAAGLNPGGPFWTAYGASKHAAQNFTEGLRKELAVFDIQVISINPSFHNTAIVANASSGAQQTWSKLSPKLREEYGNGKANDFVHCMLFVRSLLTHDPLDAFLYQIF